ncbi:ABC-2 type transport system ATP-binding protein [Parafrankia irregularis]|uniref:ABC-2 type transport system ATP-binding protein n=1 Tax=Parafrankia irregularis TaxID=795642 RepID=A0A0S4QSS2_9ACTN|nr:MULTISPECIES: ATP-binding cassette domain-containing protein [Parafrankia]MBE3205245.1 ATP-binding cassette domain-containing protein [Parafrankia sp. CH37]CUU58795.1 ABC-2 type transport system ATP-binding protein [Parafrankia irregularis]
MTAIRPAIEVSGLTKSYGQHAVLNGVDLTVPQGSVYALLGPNGAGKTTIVNILSTLLAPDGGEIRVGGFDIRREPAGVRAAIGVTGQFSAIDELLTGRENLRLMAELAHLERATATAAVTVLLERFDLVAAADRRAQTYSGGMKRRLDLAMTLITRPRLIFLDEPTAGLDPRSRRDLWAIVREQVADGVTVLLTTQYLDEADQLADRIGVLDGGRLVAEGTAAELKRRVPGGHVTVQFTDAAGLAAAAAAHPRASSNVEALTLQVPGDGSVAGLRRLLAGLDDDTVAGLTVQSADLDDVFLALTGRTAAAAPTAEGIPA